MIKNLSDRVFSVSELEVYQKCPFRYFVEYILEIKPREEKTPEGTPSEIGRFTHKVLEELFSTGAKDVKELIEKHEEIFLKRSPHINKNLWKRRMRLLEKVLAQIIDDELKEAKDPEGLAPAHFEWAFGNGKVPPLVIDIPPSPFPLPLGDPGTDHVFCLSAVASAQAGDLSPKHSAVKLRGRIDRIDTTKSNDRFMITDYKTGSQKATKKSILAGESLQLPVYIEAVKKLLYPNARAVGGTYYYLQDLTKTNITEDDWEGISKKANKTIADIVEKISKGHFVANKADCPSFCQFSEVCCK